MVTPAKSVEKGDSGLGWRGRVVHSSDCSFWLTVRQGRYSLGQNGPEDSLIGLRTMER